MPGTLGVWPLAPVCGPPRPQPSACPACSRCLYGVKLGYISTGQSKKCSAAGKGRERRAAIRMASMTIAASLAMRSCPLCPLNSHGDGFLRSSTIGAAPRLYARSAIPIRDSPHVSRTGTRQLRLPYARRAGRDGYRDPCVRPPAHALYRMRCAVLQGFAR